MPRGDGIALWPGSIFSAKCTNEAGSNDCVHDCERVVGTLSLTRIVLDEPVAESRLECTRRGAPPGGRGKIRINRNWGELEGAYRGTTFRFDLCRLY